MLRFIFKRLFYGFLVLFGVITVVFLLFNVLPADPARMMLGQRADIASIEAINKDLGRDKPLLTQYFNYLNDLSPVSVHNFANPKSYYYLDSSKYKPCVRLFNISGTKTIVLKEPYLRRSYQSKAKVSDILLEAFPLTALLALVSMLFASVLGIFTGIVSAVKKDSWFDRLAMFFSVIGMSVPSFFRGYRHRVAVCLCAGRIHRPEHDWQPLHHRRLWRRGASYFAKYYFCRLSPWAYVRWRL